MIRSLLLASIISNYSCGKFSSKDRDNVTSKGGGSASGIIDGKEWRVGSAWIEEFVDPSNPDVSYTISPQRLSRPCYSGYEDKIIAFHTPLTEHTFAPAEDFRGFYVSYPEEASPDGYDYKFAIGTAKLLEISKNAASTTIDIDFGSVGHFSGSVDFFICSGARSKVQ